MSIRRAAPALEVIGGVLAALAIAHGGELCSTDADFARFALLRWVNPLVA